MIDGPDHRHRQSSGGPRQGSPQCRARLSRREGGPVCGQRCERQPAPRQAETEKAAFKDWIAHRREAEGLTAHHYLRVDPDGPLVVRHSRQADEMPLRSLVREGILTLSSPAIEMGVAEMFAAA